MTTESKNQPLPSEGPDILADFPKPTYEEWRAEAERLLKGAPFEKKLITRTPEGIELQPIYNASDIANIPGLGEAPGTGSQLRGSRASGYLRKPWEVSQELPYATPEEFNAAALADLARGQTELNIPLDLATLHGRDPDAAESGEVGACGLSLATLADAERAFSGVELPRVSVYLHAGASALPAAALLLALARKRGVSTSHLRGCLESDPLGMLAWKGSLPVSLGRAYDEMAALTRFAATAAPGLQTIVINTQPYHDAAATATQELAFALATGIEYLRQLEQRGIAIEDALPHVRFSLCAGSHFFMEVAKFRALRQVWTQAVRALTGEDITPPIHLHARTGTYNKTIYDPYVNMLRTTTEAFSAVVGGCDSLHVGPFDEIFRLPDEFSRRIARNTQIILAEECELTKVIDPAGGSYYVEWLTHEVGKRAWDIFREIEKEGGMSVALAKEIPQKASAATAAMRAANVAKRRTIIVGTNQYPNAGEKLPERNLPDYAAIREKRARQVAEFRNSASTEADTRTLESLNAILQSEGAAAVERAIEAALGGATIGEIARALRGGDEPDVKVNPVCIHRAAQPFERLRDASAEFARTHGNPPLLFQANIGPSRTYRMRADWTSAFFEVGGFKVLNDRDFDTVEEAARAAAESGATIACITSTDDTYAEVVAPLARAIKAANSGILVLVAGAPGDNEAAWREAGVDEFVNVRSDALALLTNLLKHAKVLS